MNVEKLKAEPRVAPTEAEYLQRALQGEQDAFTVLVEAYQTPVYNLCYRMLGSPQEAEDAAQETFWRAYRNLSRYDTARSFATWLLSIAAHYCIDQQRRRRLPTIELDELLEMENIAPDPSPTPEKQALKAEELEVVQQQLNELNPNDRAVLVMRYFHEFSEEEICHALAISKSAVKIRLHRARQHMADLFLAQKEKIISERRQHEAQTI